MTDLLIRAKGVYDSERQRFPADAILLGDGVIRRIGAFPELRAANPQAAVKDWGRYYLFPGMINTHVHLEFSGAEHVLNTYLAEDSHLRFLRAAKNAEMMLLSGVTTVRDAGSSWDLPTLADGRELVKLPRMQFAGPPITMTAGHLHFQGGDADSLDEVIKAVRLRKKAGCHAIKIVVSGGQMTPGSLPERTSYPMEHIRGMTEEAHALQMKTFSHCLTTDGFVNSIRGGVDSIEHAACFVRNRENNLLERVYEEAAMEEFQGCGRWFMTGISAGYHAFDHCRGTPEKQNPRETFLLAQEERECCIFGKYIALGLIPVTGTDAGVGHTPFDETALEMELMVSRCGISPADAIATATVNAAACLGLEKTVGRLAPGYRADIIALEKNPLADIQALNYVDCVMRDGAIVKERI